MFRDLKPPRMAAGSSSILSSLRRLVKNAQDSVQEVVEVLSPGQIQVRRRPQRCAAAAKRHLTPQLRAGPRDGPPIGAPTTRAPARAAASRPPPPPPPLRSRSPRQGTARWDARRRAEAAREVEAALQRWREVNARYEAESEQRKGR